LVLLFDQVFIIGFVVSSGIYNCFLLFNQVFIIGFVVSSGIYNWFCCLIRYL